MNLVKSLGVTALISVSLFSTALLAVISESSSAKNELSHLSPKNAQNVYGVPHRRSDQTSQPLNEFIVVLDSEPLSKTIQKKHAKAAKNGQARAAAFQQSLAVLMAKDSLRKERDKLKPAMAKVADELYISAEFDTLLNGYSVQTTASKDELAKIPGIKAVYPNAKVKATLENALPIIKTQESWSLVGGQSTAGQGIRIAVIDSGITPDHPMFSDANMSSPSGLPNDDYCSSNAGFCNNKIIVARHFLPSDFSSNPDYENEFDSPRAYSGHGTHVAAIAAGRQVEADSGETISGVAPKAYLMVYKALWGEQGIGSTEGLIQALESAFADGADVINNSYGLDNTDNSSGSIFVDVFNELEAAGVVLVSSAGNEGDQGSSTISCPACVEAGIAVGSTTTDLIAGYILEFGTNDVLSQPGNNYKVGNQFSGTGKLAQDTDNLGCSASAWSGVSLTNDIAIVRRGTCTFRTKAQVAQQAGAAAMVVFNNVPGPNVLMEIGEDINLTSTFISQEDGAALLDYLDSSLIDTVSMQGSQSKSTNDAAADIVSGFSSLGPNDDDAYIKPDMSAPGDLILSAVASEDPLTTGLDYGYLGGTSMSSPMVAGAAALIKQHRPNLTAKDIKGILVNGVDNGIKGMDGSSTATAFETGSGRLNILNALELKAYSTSPNLTNNNCQVTCRISSKLRSISETTQSWSASLSFNDSELTGEVFPQQISLSTNGQEAEYEVSVNLPFNQPVGWYFGELVWTNTDGQKIVQAIAVANIATNSDKFTLTQLTESGSTATYRLVSENFTSSGTLPISLDLVGGAEFDTSSVVVSPNSGITNEVKTAQRVSFDIALQQSTFDTFSDVPFQIDVAAQSNNNRVGCAGDCDEFSAALSFDYQHMGQDFSSITIGSNGVAFVGDNVTSNDSFTTNRRLPFSGKPDGTLAPFWADFDLKNSGNANDEGGGDILFMTHTHNSKSYLVVQWDKVRLYSQGNFNATYWGVSDINAEYTFQLIIEENSDNKWFRYLSIPEQPNYYTIGVESADSSVGVTSWYDGSGTISASNNFSLRYDYTAPGEVTVEFEVNESSSNNDALSFAVNDSASGNEDESIEVDALANDLTGDRVLLIAGVEDERRMEQLFEGRSDFTLVASSVRVSTQATNGTATANTDGTITYQPDANFTGNDSFRYEVTNSNGSKSTANVAVNVTPVNDAPEVLNLSVPASTVVGRTIVLSVDAIDVDSDVTYQWNLPQGFSSGTTDESEIRVTVGSNSAATSNVSVVVSDGEFSVTASANIVVNQSSTSGGGGSSGGGSVPPWLLVSVLAIMSVRRARDYLNSKPS